MSSGDDVSSAGSREFLMLNEWAVTTDLSSSEYAISNARSKVPAGLIVTDLFARFHLNSFKTMQGSPSLWIVIWWVGGWRLLRIQLEVAFRDAQL